MRIVVAMSGGVDSSVAAALLVEQGHEVIGLSMQLYDQRGPDAAAFGSCCSLDDLHDARRVASVLGIPYYLVNFERQFEAQVIGNFVSEYAAGRTPIPCTHCNADLKFATLLARARGLGAEALATGHYARVERDAAGGPLRLRRGLDADKDQSYFLFSLDQVQLAAARFPVGGMPKAAVRAHARRCGLPVADKPDSHELCFVPDGDHAAFLERRAPALARGGALRDPDGRLLGRHGGVHRFTVGQRKGLGLSSRVPLYVLSIAPETGDVVVGSRAGLARRRLSATGVNWIAGAPPTGTARVTAQIRHRHAPAPARVRAAGTGRAALAFDAAQEAVAPGQAVVFYEGDDVLGGGWIERTEAAGAGRADRG